MCASISVGVALPNDEGGLLPTAANYVNLITGPRREGETDGPEELHLVIVDGGRGALRGTEFEEASGDSLNAQEPSWARTSFDGVEKDWQASRGP